MSRPPVYPRTVAAVLAVLVAGCSGSHGTQAKSSDADVQPIVTTNVKHEKIRRQIEVVGTLAAAEMTVISSEVEGKVTRVLADLGDRVRSGQVLVELDREKLQYRLDEQRAALTRARAKYGVTDGGTTTPTVETTPDVQKAAAELTQAEQSHKRAQELQKRALLPQSELEEAETRLQTAKAAYDSALQNARNLRADIDGAEAQARLADRELRDAAIRAPFDAYVQERLVSPGQYLKVQTPVMSLVMLDPLKLTGEIPERLAPWVRVGQKVSVAVDAFPDRPLEGTIARLAPAVNPQTRAFPIEARVPNADGSLKPGTFARVRIASDRVDDVLTVPASSLQYRYGVNRVFVIKGDVLVSREVKIGDRVGERVEVTEGVDAGEPIAAQDVDRLTDGIRVKASRAE